MNYSEILSRKYAGQEWSLDNNDYATLLWLSDTPKPTKQELENLWPEIKAILDVEADEKKVAKASALGKLEALGLTADDLKALGL